MVERSDRAPVATFYVPDLPPAGGEVSLPDAAARHAAVRRLSEGNVVRLTSGAGAVAIGSITRLRKAELTAHVSAAEFVARPPLLEVLPPVADRDRMLWLAEKCAEFAVSVWQPVIFARSRSVAPRGEGEAFSEKTRARMVAALEQSGGAWLPEIRREVPFADAVAGTSADTRFVLHRAGGPLRGRATRLPAAVVFGPEGGMEQAEHDVLDASGWQRVTLGPTTLRFETAGLAAVAILRAGAYTGHAEEQNG